MACYTPLPATPVPGKRPLIHARTRYVPRPGDIYLPCGKCIGCRADRQQNWAIRCLHESQLHPRNCALTLTYSDDPNYEAVASQDRAYQHQDMLITRKSARELSTAAPKGLDGPNIATVGNSRLGGREEVGSLSISDHQKFMKRLRKEVGVVRFYMCGEYGTKLERPHFHYLLFGYDFPDKYYFKKSLSGTKLYRSELLESIWTAGHAWIGEVDYDTCAYVAGYVMKKMDGPKAQEHYRRTDEAGNDYWLEPEFNQMSRRPGIGKKWWDKYSTDVTVIDKVRHNGRELPVPRYYDKLHETADPVGLATAKMMRRFRAELKGGQDSTPRRLLDRELVHKGRLKLKKHTLE